MRKWIQLIVTLLVVILICMPLTTVQMDRISPAATELPMPTPTVLAAITPQPTAEPAAQGENAAAVETVDVVADITEQPAEIPLSADEPTAEPAAETSVPTEEPTAEPTAEVEEGPTVEPTTIPGLPAVLPINTGARDAEGDDTIKSIQQRLIDLNFLFDVADGAFGANSTEAVFAFQAANGLPEYGVVDDVTYYALFSDNAIAGPEPTPEPMGRGASGAEVTEVQDKLAMWGFIPFAPDGSYGDGTIKGVKALQQYLHDYGPTLATEDIPSLLPADVTPEPTPEPTATPEPTPEPTPVPPATAEPTLPAGLPIVLGSRDAAGATCVADVQKRLIELGYLNDTADGAFGAKSIEAVKAFQTTHGLQADGSVGAETWRTLNAWTAIAVTPAPYVEPTPTPYAPDGKVDEELLEYVRNGRFDIYRQDVKKGDQNDDAFRVQRRLASLDYMYTSACDGAFGASSEFALKYFQKRNNLPQTGVADEATQKKLFSNTALKSAYIVYPYSITVDVSDQRVYVYAWNGDGYDAEPVQTFVCSTGTKKNPTPLGTYSADGRATQDQWYYFKDFRCYAQYAFRIFGGILFHSVTYDEPNEKTLHRGALNNLGKPASHGCIRLKVEDAKWIFENCPAGLTVTIQE